MTLEQDLVDSLGGSSRPTQESIDEIYPYPDMVADDLIRKYTTQSPMFRLDSTPQPLNYGQNFDFGGLMFNPTQRSPGEGDTFEMINLNDNIQTVDKLIGNVDDLETFCNPDNMTILVQRSVTEKFSFYFQWKTENRNFMNTLSEAES